MSLILTVLSPGCFPCPASEWVCGPWSKTEKWSVTVAPTSLDWALAVTTKLIRSASLLPADLYMLLIDTAPPAGTKGWGLLCLDSLACRVPLDPTSEGSGRPKSWEATSLQAAEGRHSQGCGLSTDAGLCLDLVSTHCRALGRQN